MAEDVLRARYRAERFHEELARLLNRYDPREYAAAVASMLLRFLDRREKWRFYPPHFLINSIEVNCAYHKSYRRDEVTQRGIDRIAELYKSFPDPYYEHVLEDLKNPELFALAMARQQFPYQIRPTKDTLLYALALFGSDKLPRAADLFAQQLGFAPEDWVVMNFLVQAYSLGQNTPRTEVKNYTESEIRSIPRKAVRPFLDAVSYTPQEVGSRYRAIRDGISAHLHSLVSSVFLDRPLLSFEDGSYLVIHPGLLSRHCVDGLYERCETAGGASFRTEFGLSFEKFVGDMLHDLEGATVWNERQIQVASPGKACDYLVRHRDCLLLVECKSVRFSATLPTEKAIAGDNSTGKVADAFEQLFATAARIRGGALAPLVGERPRQLVGFVITFGDLYFANTPLYLDSFVLRRAHLEVVEKWPNPFCTAPQTVCFTTFEKLIAVLNATESSVAGLLDDLRTQEEFSGADLSVYLDHFDLTADAWMLPFLKELDDALQLRLIGGHSSQVT